MKIGTSPDFPLPSFTNMNIGEIFNWGVKTNLWPVILLGSHIGEYLDIEKYPNIR